MITFCKKALTIHEQDRILDSGASKYMTSQLSVMVDAKEIASVPVGLPNCSRTLATKAGKIHVTHHVVLNGVFFALDLTCNLISMHQLVRS